MADWCIRVPASSANLGAGFDVLGMALTLHAEVGCGDPPVGAIDADDSHPATVAFRELGGVGGLWVRSSIPMGRGLGSSGAVRVGGAAAAIVQAGGGSALEERGARAEVLDMAVRLEGHADNAAASLLGGVVVAADDKALQIPLVIDPGVVVWVPGATTTSTDKSRAQLPDVIERSDAVFNLGRVAAFVAACGSGDVEALRWATEDRMHQPARLARVPGSADAIDAGLAAGAWAAWLSGSGPTVAMFCDPVDIDEVASALPTDGHTKQLHIDHAGATVTAVDGPSAAP